MKPSEHRYRDDLSSLTSMRRACSRCAGGPLSQRSMRAPVVEIADIFGQGPLQMALIEDEHVVQALGSDGSHSAFGDGVGSRRSEWRANLGNTNIAHPTTECGTVTAVAVMNEKSWQLAIPSAAFDHLLSRPRGGGIRKGPCGSQFCALQHPEGPLSNGCVSHIERRRGRDRTGLRAGRWLCRIARRH